MNLKKIGCELIVVLPHRIYLSDSVVISLNQLTAIVKELFLHDKNTLKVEINIFWLLRELLVAKIVLTKFINMTQNITTSFVCEGDENFKYKKIKKNKMKVAWHSYKLEKC